VTREELVALLAAHERIEEPALRRALVKARDGKV